MEERRLRKDPRQNGLIYAINLSAAELPSLRDAAQLSSLGGRRESFG